ncbi:tetratricopeptide repeat protein [Pontibacter rugosus]|uniref:Tetratricopeptide repeat protein n=1 Tax=Pontibacter rugosus TaxID=1745966 RepID=A0ABW3SPT3_9BACT
MKKILLATIAFCCAASLSFAQDKVTETSTKVLPMFGGKQKTEAEQMKDEKFLTSCDKNFSNRQEASKFFMERGWEYLNEGQTDTAMYRFNLAWLLNPGNKDTYWAFGLVSSAQGNTNEAVDLYEKAIAIDGKNSLLLSDASEAYLTLYKDKNKKKHLKKAAGYLASATTLDGSNSFALYNMSLVKYYEKKYAEAWDYLHKSRNINMTQIDYGYVMDLVAKMPDPQGFFKQGEATATTN